MDALNGSTSQYLLAWHHGDQASLEMLLERHLPWIQSYVHRKLSKALRTKADTGDIVQDAMVQFLRYGPRFQISDDRRFRALLARIIENVLHDKYDWFTARRRAIAKERPLPPDTVLNLDPPGETVNTPSQIVIQHEREAWVRLALELLDPEQRQVILLHDWENQSFAEIGMKIKVSKGTARRRYLESIHYLIETVHALQQGKLDAVLKLEPV